LSKSSFFQVKLIKLSSENCKLQFDDNASILNFTLCRTSKQCVICYNNHKPMNQSKNVDE